MTQYYSSLSEQTPIQAILFSYIDFIMDQPAPILKIRRTRSCVTQNFSIVLHTVLVNQVTLVTPRESGLEFFNRISRLPNASCYAFTNKGIAQIFASAHFASYARQKSTYLPIVEIKFNFIFFMQAPPSYLLGNCPGIGLVRC